LASLESVAEAVPRTSASAIAPDRFGEEGFVRVPNGKMRAILALASELVVAASNLGREFEGEASNAVTGLTERMYRAVLDTNMIPAGDILVRHHRTISDVSRATGKKMRFVVGGGDVEVDKTVAEKLSEPLMHLVRNAADHGIESKELRLARGKDPEGTVKVAVRQDAGYIVIEVSADGRGGDPAAIRARAEAMGLLKPGDAEPRLYDYLFLPGFSLSADVTLWSGRGVGMDVVKKSIMDLRGTVAFSSEPGKGSSVRIRIPVSLSLVEGFIAVVNGYRLVIPYEDVRYCVEVDRGTLEWEGSCGTLVAGESLIPFVDLVRLFPGGSDEKPVSIAAVVASDSGNLAILVDEVGQTVNVVIRPLSRRIMDVEGIAGVSALGDGSLVLVLDPSGLAEAFVK